MFKKIANIFKNIFKNRTKDSMYKIDDRLFFYYVDENNGRINCKISWPEF